VWKGGGQGAWWHAQCGLHAAKVRSVANGAGCERRGGVCMGEGKGVAKVVCVNMSGTVVCVAV